VGNGLDFLVIGAQKAGTTSLWRYLSSHPEVHMPPSKEAPFFSHDQPYGRGFEWYLEEFFAGAPSEARWGTATPHYMMGSTSTAVPEVARRIADQLPEVRLIALLRDPIDRARSHHRMSVHRALEQRSFEHAAAELLAAEALEEGRVAPTEINSYLVQGEYGRILGAYLERFPPHQLQVALTQDLERRPAEVLEAIHAFLGVSVEHVPPDLGAHYHRGGTGRRLDEAAERELKDYLASEVWPLMPHSREARRSFDAWYRSFNVAPDSSTAPPIDPALEVRLRTHYAQDAIRLEELTGLRVPWLSPTAGRP